MKTGPLEFLWAEDNTTPYKPSVSYVLPAYPESANQLHVDKYGVRLEPVRGKHPTVPIPDLKRWMLFENRDTRIHTLAPVDGKSVYRRFTRERIFREHVRLLVEEARRAVPDANISFLIPAIEDAKARERYVDGLVAADKDAKVLSEPEMVAEYFRLVLGKLVLDKDRNNVVLVVDIGASTANLTIVLTNQGGEVVAGDAQRRRAGRLRAIQGIAGDRAGRWLDEQLLRYCGPEIGDSDEERAERDKLIERCERLKVEVSASGKDAADGPIKVSIEDLRALVDELCDGLESPLRDVSSRLWEQVNATDFAREQSASVREERGVVGPEQALLLVDHVILAGGSSQLPGVDDWLAQRLHKDVSILRVGSSFGIAAAVGGLAHVLHHAGKLKTPDEDAEGVHIELEGGLESDVVLGTKGLQRDAKEQAAIVLRRGDPLIYSGGRRPDVGSLDAHKGTTLKARLYESDADRREVPFREVSTRRSRPKYSVFVSPDRAVRLESSWITNINALFLQLGEQLEQPPIESEPAVRRPRKSKSAGLKAGQVAFDEAPEVVIDLGMSKTVMVCSRGGLLEVATLEPSLAPPKPKRRRKSLVDAAPTTGDVGVNTAPAPVALDAPVVVEAEAGPVVVAVDTSPAAEVEAAADVPAVETAAPVPVVVATPIEVVQPPTKPKPRRAKIAADAGQHPPARWAHEYRMSVDEAGKELVTVLNDWKERAPSVDLSNLVLALLAVSVRPMVLVAGPPGCGKSTLVHRLAQFLGRKDGSDFRSITVHGHWRDDSALFGGDEPLLAKDDGADDRDVMLLLDEINLSRPEHYLQCVFASHDAADRGGAPSPWFGLGTLNIDEASRPPSPKIIDRCYLLELEPPTWAELKRPRARLPADIASLPALPKLPAEFTVDTADVDGVVDALATAVREHTLRQDILPSRRVAHDLHNVLALYDGLGIAGTKTLARDDLVDHFVASRIMAKLLGAHEQMAPALEALGLVVKDKNWPRTQARLELMQSQSVLGFVSPWQ